MTDTKISLHLKARIEACRKSEAQIADEIGYERGRVISMFETGEMRIPLSIAGELAIAVEDDPVHFIQLMIESYAPETHKWVRWGPSMLLTARERSIIEVVRRVSNGTNPPITPFRREMIEALFLDVSP